MRQPTWRDGWEPFRIDTGGGRMLQPERSERTYPSTAAYQRDAAALAKDGWQVATVVNHLPRGVVARTMARVWSTVRRRPAPAVVVTYKRLH